MNPHTSAPLLMVVGTGVGTLLMADAAEDASHRMHAVRRRALLRRGPGRFSLWDHPVILQSASVVLLAIMALCGICLLCTSP